jgi:hypothetical protein
LLASAGFHDLDRGNLRQALVIRAEVVRTCGGAAWRARWRLADACVRCTAPKRRENGAAHERTTVDVRIGVTQAPREINVEMADDSDRAAVKSKAEAALAGAVDVLWLTDKKGRDVGVPAAKIAYIEIGTAEGERRIGFGG